MRIFADLYAVFLPNGKTVFLVKIKDGEDVTVIGVNSREALKKTGAYENGLESQQYTLDEFQMSVVPRDVDLLENEQCIRDFLGKALCYVE